MGVGRLFDKLFGSDAEKDQTALRAYGKLPFYAEYRRLEVSHGAPTTFSQWMDAGRLAWVRSPTKSDAGAMRSSRLVVRLPKTKETIVASVWDSRDSLGRVFPFAFFIACAPEALGGDPVERWVVAAGIHRTFDRFYAQLHALGSGGDFYRLYQKRVITLRPGDLTERARSLRAEAAQIAAEPWFKAVTLDGEIAASTWFAGLLRRAERWRSEPASLAETAISCPLARGFSYGAQAVLWLEWLGGLFGKVGRTPWLVVPMESDRSALALHLVTRELLPDDYQLMTTDDRVYDFVQHLSSPLALDAAAAGAPAIDVPTGSLLAWLKEHAP